MRYGRSSLAMTAALSSHGAVSICGLALTLLMTAPLMPIEALARA
jgi:hypothetical protein